VRVVTRARVTAAAAATVIARALDRRHGLVSEIQTSTSFGGGRLYVTLARSAPRDTRAAVRHRLLLGICAIPARTSWRSPVVGTRVSVGMALHC
jgi:hypothetical protein